MQSLLLQELLVLHQVLLISNQEEEEQEDEEKKKRGDATLQTSLHTVQVFRLLCNVTILRYHANTSVHTYLCLN